MPTQFPTLKLMHIGNIWVNINFISHLTFVHVPGALAPGSTFQIMVKFSTFEKPMNLLFTDSEEEFNNYRDGLIEWLQNPNTSEIWTVP